MSKRLAAGLSSLLETEIRREVPATDADTSTSLQEDDQALQPPPRPSSEEGGDLLECCMDAAPYGYSERSFEDKLRDACATLRYAIQDEAYKGLGDDGRAMRNIDEDEDRPWQAVEKMLVKRIYPNMFKDLVSEARSVLDAYYE